MAVVRLPTAQSVPNTASRGAAKEGTIFEEHGRWYLSACNEVDAYDLKLVGVPVGMDRIVRQVAASDGHMFTLKHTSKLARRICTLQERLTRQQRGSRRRAKTRSTIVCHQLRRNNIRTDDLRHLDAEIAEYPTIVILEDLKTKDMSRSTRGTVGNPRTKCAGEGGPQQPDQDDQGAQQRFPQPPTVCQCHLLSPGRA